MQRDIHLYELTLGRVLDYLERCGVELTPSTLRSVLKVIETALAQGEDSLLARALDDLPKHIELPAAPPHASMPPLRREHIGYG